jgi:glutamyl-tRNA synthetase
VSEPSHAHVPLVLGPDGARLAKRHGGVTLREVPADAARAWMAQTLAIDLDPATFDPGAIPREPTTWGSVP